MKTHRNGLRKIGRQLGFSLIEGLIAIALFSFGVLAIMNLQAQTIKHGGESKYRIDAGFLASQLVGEMWANRTNLAQYVNASYLPRQTWNSAVSSALPAGAGMVEVVATQVTITVTWQAPGQSQHRHVVIADINGS
jgi:type IV pilus assembly protein PilV